MSKQRVTPQAPDTLHALYSAEATPAEFYRARTEQARKYEARMAPYTPDERSTMRKARGWTQGQIALAFALLPVVTAVIGLIVLAVIK